MKKILVIDDDRKIAMALALRLKAAGFETSTAHDAVTGVNAAIKQKPDLILLDISMPAGNGFVVAERVQLLASVAIPIIFLTASKQEGLAVQAEKLGAVGFFEKPYDADALLHCIKTALGME